MEERPGDATFLGDPLTVVGPRLHKLADLRGKVAVLNVVVSLDTPVCHTQTRRCEAERKDLPADVEILTISKDLPYAQARWKAAEGVTYRTLTAYQDDQFAVDYGVLFKEPRLLQRSMFVIDPDARIKHVEYVSEPDRRSHPAIAEMRRWPSGTSFLRTHPSYQQVRSAGP